LGRDRVLGDLNEHFLPFLQQILDIDLAAHAARGARLRGNAAIARALLLEALAIRRRAAAFGHLAAGVRIQRRAVGTDVALFGDLSLEILRHVPSALTAAGLRTLLSFAALAAFAVATTETSSAAAAAMPAATLSLSLAFAATGGLSAAFTG